MQSCIHFLFLSTFSSGRTGDRNSRVPGLAGCVLQELGVVVVVERMGMGIEQGKEPNMAVAVPLRSVSGLAHWSSEPELQRNRSAGGLEPMVQRVRSELPVDDPTMACELQRKVLSIQSKAILPRRGSCNLLIANSHASYGRERRLYALPCMSTKLTTVTSAISIPKGWYQPA